MGWRDRPYAYGDAGGGAWRTGGGLGLPKPGRVVKWLLLLNIGVFLIQQFTGPGAMWGLLALARAYWWQPWRYVSFQFVHSGFMHILFNMLGLYFLGTPLEGKFGPRRFLAFYLLCGAAAGLAFLVVGALAQISLYAPIGGASGGVMAIILAAAVYFPHFRLLLLFFPVPIRVAAVLIFAFLVFTLLGGFGAMLRGEPMPAEIAGRFWSEVAHFGGAFAGAGYLIVRHYRPGGGGTGPFAGTMQKLKKGAWQRKMEQQRSDEEQIDHILQKIHQKGIQSLTRTEKRILKRATDRQRQEDERIRKL